MAQTRVLADRFIEGEGLARDLLRLALGNVLLVLCAWIVIPLPWTPVPITGQTFGVLLVAVLLGARRGSTVMVMYLLEGLAGLPVFAPVGLLGLARFFGPTAGYLLSYPLAAFVTGWIVQRGMGRPILRLGTALLAGEIVIFAIGCAWLAGFMHLGLAGTLVDGALPFLPGEAIKIGLIVAAVSGIELARKEA
jgi:biotin transport system substrate-specific component